TARPYFGTPASSASNVTSDATHAPQVFNEASAEAGISGRCAMPTFTFTNNSAFDVFFYRITQSGTLIREGDVTPRERTKTFILDLPAGTELHFTTEMTMDLSSDGPVVYHDTGITVDTYRTTGADRQTHTIRDINTQLNIRNNSAAPVFLFTVDPRS